MQLDLINDESKTEVGSYFVSNYPPFSVWSSEHVPAVHRRLGATSKGESLRENGETLACAAGFGGVPLGLYIHIPFCRKRCTFCYYRVYTDKNARDVDEYMEALAHEVALYADRPALAGRTFEFVYFGGGTPSFLSADQLHRLIDRIGQYWSWDKAREVTFECEPGTLQESKLRAIKEIGVTRLSLGVEHFDDAVLEGNGRAHHSKEIFRAYAWARETGFDQINIDLIAGMVGDTDAGWRATVDRAVALDPDSVTIYQMEVPHNTVIARDSKTTGQPTPVADWTTKRRWVDQAFGIFEQAGYVVSSAYTVVKPSVHSRFVYRDAVWHGADMIGTGVASFSHLDGIHYQNADRWEDYIARLGAGELPIERALPITDRQRLIRELVLQIKLGRVEAKYFRDKFGVDIVTEFAEALESLAARGWAAVDGDVITLSRAGLLRVDAWVPMFFEPQYRNIRYT